MALTSSPLVFPPSSSPAAVTEPRKRKNASDLPRASKRKWADLIQANTFDQDKENRAPSQSAVTLEDTRKDESNFPGVAQAVDEEWDPFARSDQAASYSNATKCGAIHELASEELLKLPRVQEPPFSDCFSVGKVQTTSGKALRIRAKRPPTPVTYEELIASRSTTKAGRATRSYYGIDIHELLADAAKLPKKPSPLDTGPYPEIKRSIEVPTASRRSRSMLWTEKYRARKFTDLVGDERTHRHVLRWLKGWDSIVFPGVSRPKSKFKLFGDGENERYQRKILMLAGPPGLGKTTLAHVCARQAGYEVTEINASDERSRDVVKGRIRDIVGTENVRGVNTEEQGKTVRKAARPVCVVVDEVDGVVGGSGGGGEGGFIKALMDLISIDQRNSSRGEMGIGATKSRGTKKGDQFRMLRPIILICNDVYHPSLRALRSSSLAEIIHLRKPPLDKVIARIKHVFEKEGISCENDGARRLCEAAWGISSRREAQSKSSAGEGDLRSILVVGEWVAAKLRTSETSSAKVSTKLTRRWVEQNLLDSLSHGGSGARGLGRGGTKEAVERVFLEGAGFSKEATSTVVHVPEHSSIGSTLHVSEPGKQHAMNRLREVVDTSGEVDRIVSDCFAIYPSQPFQDDTYLSKPSSAYEWLHFHDTLSSKVYSHQEWELNPYLAHSVLGFHNLFASPARHTFSSSDHQNKDEESDQPAPFSGPRAAYQALETTKQNHALLSSMHSSFSIPVFQSFRSPEAIATDLVPYLNHILSPDVKPVVIGGSSENKGIVSVRRDSERAKISRAAEVMAAVGVTFEWNRVESGGSAFGGQHSSSSYIYRMEPPIDTLATFETACADGGKATTTRYAVRQALDQEYQKYIQRRNAESRRERCRALNGGEPFGDVVMTRTTTMMGNNAVGSGEQQQDEVKNKKDASLPRDFFGRPIIGGEDLLRPRDGGGDEKSSSSSPSFSNKEGDAAGKKVWVSFNEGYSNAVRKPISLEELMRGFF